MDRIPQRDKPPEGTPKSTGKAGPKPWETSQYIHQEEPRDGHGSSHGDPRLEFALQRLSLQDDFISSDEESEHGSLHPAFGIRATPDLHASASSASDLGTLAGTIPSNAAGDYARRNMSGEEYESYKAYKRAINKKAAPTQEQRAASAKYRRLTGAYNRQTGAARWRAKAPGLEHGVVRRAWK
jgi:hypothetical protein